MTMLLARNNSFSDPFTALLPFVREFFAEDTGETTWAPPTDIFVHDDAVEIVADMPGLSLEGISVTVDNGVLTLKAERKRPEGNLEACCSERPYGTFERSFTLGEDLDTEGIEARYEAGVLRVRIPKRPEVQPRRIEVKQ